MGPTPWLSPSSTRERRGFKKLAGSHLDPSKALTGGFTESKSGSYTLASDVFGTGNSVELNLSQENYTHDRHVIAYLPLL